MAAVDAPSWTFGLNPKITSCIVPGPGAYDIAGQLLADGVGTRFGWRSLCDRKMGPRLTFDGEKENGGKPGPGAYETQTRPPPQYSRRRLAGKQGNTAPRFSTQKPATDAGPGAYVSPQFTSRGPAHTIPARLGGIFSTTQTPGPGHNIGVELGNRRNNDESARAYFGNRSSLRFAVERETTPGPGAYQLSRSEQQVGRGKTFGGRFRPAGWSVKIKEMALFPWELDDSDGGKPFGRARAGLSVCSCLQRRPFSAPRSTRIHCSCAPERGPKRTDVSSKNRSNYDIAVEDDGRRRDPQISVTRNYHVTGMVGPGARNPHSFRTALQRPPDAPPPPGPSTYNPPTLDELARKRKVVTLGSKSRRDLFPSCSPATPSPADYSREIVQGRALNAELIANTTLRGGPFDTSRPHPRAGTFGCSERFPRDIRTVKPGVGDYDVTAAEKAKSTMSMGRRPEGAPYEPSLGYYLRADNLYTPSPHSYRPESAIGCGGEKAVAGRSPAWSFGVKQAPPRRSDGPGPGRYRPQSAPIMSSAKFGVGREDTRGCVSRVPWVEVEERAARGEWGGRDAKLYFPGRTRMGAKVSMTSRRLQRSQVTAHGL